MGKETYYFSHDYEPTGDPKMAAMVSEYGLLGYGIFWRIVEMLHSDKDHKLPLKLYVYQSIAKQMLDCKKVKLPIDDLSKFVEMFINDCISIFDLFIEANEAVLEANEAKRSTKYFASNRVFQNIQTKLEKKLEKSEAGKIGGIKSGESRRNKKQNEANEAVLEANEPNEAKESKLKENINNNIKKENDDFVCYNVEDFILGNKQIFESICMRTGKGIDFAKKELRNYHLWLEKKSKYPIGKKPVTAGYESWLINGFYKNGTVGSKTTPTIVDNLTKL